MRLPLTWALLKRLGPADLVALTETRDFRPALVAEAEAHGWICWWVHDSRHSPKGWPDIFACRPPRVWAAELKTERGRLTADQASALRLLAAAGIPTYLWRPSQWRTIEKVLA